MQMMLNAHTDQHSGSLDKDSIHYLMTRGLNKKEVY